MRLSDLEDISKVLFANIGALGFSSLDLNAWLSVGEAVESLLQIGLLTTSLVYTIHKIHEIRKREDQSGENR